MGACPPLPESPLGDAIVVDRRPLLVPLERCFAVFVLGRFCAVL